MKGCSPSPDSACIRLPGLLGVIHNAAIFFGFYSFATHRTKTRPCSTNGASGPLKALYGTSKAKPRLSVLRSFEGHNPPAQSFVQYIESHTRLKQNTPTSNKWSVVNKIMGHFASCKGHVYTRQEGLPRCQSTLYNSSRISPSLPKHNPPIPIRHNTTFNEHIRRARAPIL